MRHGIRCDYQLNDGEVCNLCAVSHVTKKIAMINRVTIATLVIFTTVR